MNGDNQRDGHIPERAALDAWLEHDHTGAAGSLSTRIAGSSASEAVAGAESGSCCVANAEDTGSTGPSAVEAVVRERVAEELDTVASTGVDDVASTGMMASGCRLGLAVEASVAGNHCWEGSRGPSLPCSYDEAGAARGARGC